MLPTYLDLHLEAQWHWRNPIQLVAFRARNNATIFTPDETISQNYCDCKVEKHRCR